MERPLSQSTLSILHVSESFNARYSGGAGAYLEDMCFLLADRGHRVAVLCPESGPEEPYAVRREEVGPVDVFRVNLPLIVDRDPEGWTLGLAGWLRHQKRLRPVVESVVEGWRPNLLLQHLPRPFGEDAFSPTVRRKAPLARVLHDAWALCMRLQLIRSPRREVCQGPALPRCLFCMYTNFDSNLAQAFSLLPWRILKQGPLPAHRTLRRRFARGAVSSSLALSRFMRDLYRRHREPVDYVDLGINLQGLPRVRPPRPRTPLRFTFVAGFQPHKGAWDVLRAAGRLLRSGLPFELHLWGPGTEEQVQAEIRSQQLSAVARHHGIYAAADRWKVYWETDVAIMATTWVEPLGRVVKEAAAAGVPTIAPDIGGLSEQIRHGTDGLLFRFRDAEDLERQMKRLLLEPQLYDGLVAKLTPVRDTREAIADVESFCRRVVDGPHRPGQPPSP